MPSSSFVEVEVGVEVGIEVGAEVGVEVGVQMFLKSELKQLDRQVHNFFRGGWVVGWGGRIENKAILAFN